jgi:hypothetical protein
MNDFATQVTGWLFIASAFMLWLGWTLMPVHLGPFFTMGDFSRVHSSLRRWIWLYRVHLFGYVVTVMAFVALGTLLAETLARIVVWPAVAVAGTGLIVAALAAAFYYHFGAWGAIDMQGKSPEALQGFVDSLRVSTEYVTCLVRFGRVFFGLGQVVLAVGFLQGDIMPLWVTISAAVLGLAGMGLTMAFPDNLECYQPVFHLTALWLVTTGIVVLRFGLRVAG